MNIGIDEAGRGPLAGPVWVGACAILDDTIDLSPFDDSKKMTERQREIAYKLIQSYAHQNKLLIASSFARASTIDRLGIISAQKQAMKKVIKTIIKQSTTLKSSGSPRSNISLLIDGNHTFGLEKYSPLGRKGARGEVKTIIYGDSLIPEISIASIIAKVERDHFMIRQSKKHPLYGFEKHKGYGTRHHREMIATHGPSPIHRKSFCGNITI